MEVSVSRENDIYQKLQEDIRSADFDEMVKKKLFQSIIKLKNEKVNLMITGATGCGKSSTINALFETEVAKVGVGVDPETMDIKKFDFNNLILWDSPGLGDGKDKDNRHSKNIIDKLNEIDNDGNAVIDLVLVVLDGSSRDLGTSYELINNVIIPNLGKDPEKRILIAINQADMAMKGRGWNHAENKPDRNLIDFLEDKINSVKRRIKEATNISVDPIYYVAGYKEDGQEQRPFNLSKLFYMILEYTPKNKRLAYASSLSSDKEMWSDNDELKDYNQEIRDSFLETISDGIDAGGEIGKELGDIIGMGKTGEFIGKVAGGFIGSVKAVGSWISSWFD